MTDPTTQEALTFEQARRLRRLQVTTDAQAIFDAPTQTQALERLAAFRTRWGQLESEVVRLLGKDIELSLTFYQFDAPDAFNTVHCPGQTEEEDGLTVIDGTALTTTNTVRVPTHPAAVPERHCH